MYYNDGMIDILKQRVQVRNFAVTGLTLDGVMTNDLTRSLCSMALHRSLFLQVRYVPHLL